MKEILYIYLVFIPIGMIVGVSMDYFYDKKKEISIIDFLLYGILSIVTVMAMIAFFTKEFFSIQAVHRFINKIAKKTVLIRRKNVDTDKQSK